MAGDGLAMQVSGQPPSLSSVQRHWPHVVPYRQHKSAVGVCAIARLKYFATNSRMR
jgi:hypothetical protein